MYRIHLLSLKVCMHHAILDTLLNWDKLGGCGAMNSKKNVKHIESLTQHSYRTHKQPQTALTESDRAGTRSTGT